MYGFWLLLWYLFVNTIVLSVSRFTASHYLFGTFSLIPLYCLSLDLRLLITSLVLFLEYHFIVCPSIYGFWFPLWYFFFNTIVLSVPRFTASGYLFGTLSLIPLYCLSFDLRLLITTLVLFFNTIVLSVPRLTASDYLFDTFSLIPLYCLSLYLRFWSPLWYFFLNTIVLSVPRFTASDFLFGTFSLIHFIVCPSIYSFWLPLWYFFFDIIVLSVPRFTTSDYLFGTLSLIPLYCLSLDLRLLITSLVLFL